MSKIRPDRIAHISVAKLIAAMSAAPTSIEDLAEASGLCITTVRHYVIALRKEGAAFVGEYQADRRGNLSVKGYSIGKGKDAAKPKATPTAASSRWRAWADRRQQATTLRLIAGVPK